MIIAHGRDVVVVRSSHLRASVLSSFTPLPLMRNVLRPTIAWVLPAFAAIR